VAARPLFQLAGGNRHTKGRAATQGRPYERNRLPESAATPAGRGYERNRLPESAATPAGRGYVELLDFSAANGR